MISLSQVVHDLFRCRLALTSAWRTRTVMARSSQYTASLACALSHKPHLPLLQTSFLPHCPAPHKTVPCYSGFATSRRRRKSRIRLAPKRIAEPSVCRQLPPGASMMPGLASTPSCHRTSSRGQPRPSTLHDHACGLTPRRPVRASQRTEILLQHR